MAENRRHARVSSRLRCWCEGENVTVYARVGNISEGGMFLRTSTPLERGAKATLRFGQEEPVEAHALVVWSRVEGETGPPGMGLAFQDVDDGRREKIRRILETEARHSKRNGGN